MPFYGNLTQHLAGIYRLGDRYVIYPQPGIPDWDVIINHEFTHKVLAVSTTSGLIHQILAYLSYHSDTKLKQHWQKAYIKAIEYCVDAHEAAATFVSLNHIILNNGLDETIKDFKISPKYVDWYKMIESAVPKELPTHLQSLFGRAIANYAFDDPLEEWMEIRWSQLTTYNELIKFLPKINERFYQLIEKMSGGKNIFVVDKIPRYFFAELVFDKDKETYRQYLARRRNAASKIEKGLRDILEIQFENNIKVVKFGTDGLNQFF